MSSEGFLQENQRDVEANDHPQSDENANEQGTDPYMVVFWAFSILTGIAALLCAAVNIISMVRSFMNGRNIFEGILRLYAVVIALFVAVAETEWETIMKFWRMLEFWAGRGMLQIFVAVMTIALSNERKDKAYEVVLAQVSSGLLLACGAIYIIAGLLCVGRLKRSRMDKSNWRERASKEIEELDRRRDDLQNMLHK